MIPRNEYLNWLTNWREKQVIKVMTCVRRCGKSTLFQLYIDQLKQTGVADEQIISVNLEDVEYENLLTYRALYDFIKTRLVKGKYTYIFIDEVQQCEQFEIAVNSLFIHENVDLYITGSNAFMLSGELATLLSGRYVEIQMLPLSFAEYYGAVQAGSIDTGATSATTTNLNLNPTTTTTNPPSTTDKNPTRSEIFTNYLRYGSFPYVASLQKDDTSITTYLDGIYNTILIKDVATRESIRNISELESVIKFLAGSIGSPISVKKISDSLNSAGRKTSQATIDRYLRALCDSYIFYKCDRYDIKGKQHLKTLGKYYIVDTGLRDLLIRTSATDLGHLLENIVYLELLRRGNKVNIGKVAEREVDFVASNYDGVVYYQVSATTLDENTLQRELEPLRKISDNYPKILLTLDDYQPEADYEGIQKIHLLDWLLSSP